MMSYQVESWKVEGLKVEGERWARHAEPACQVVACHPEPVEG